ncbi:MAG: hypothetical protein PHH55_00550 [Candidatus Delongbacteria bacterium]|nr:hypothetical protein [Candidatus Delongbacteria bacterium]
MDSGKLKLISKILNEVAEDLVFRYYEEKKEAETGLMTGKSGASLYLFHYSKYSKNEKYKKYAQTLLEEVFEDINSGKYYSPFCGGLAGVCWTIIHLVENGFIHKENLEVLDELDDYLNKSMNDFISQNYFDFLHGASGIAYYFSKKAERNPASTSKYLEYYVKKLNEYAVYNETDGTAKIISNIYDADSKPVKVFNLSLSHGISSLVIVLSSIKKTIGFSEELDRLINGFINFIIINKNISKTDNNSLYPGTVPLTSQRKNIAVPSRLGWCYGDIGNGYAFISGASVNGSKSYLYNTKAEEIFLNLQKRKEPSLQAINDAGICHGSAGMVCMSRSLNELYKQNVYKDLEDYWIDITLEFYNRKNGLDGFSRFINNEYEYDISFLSGTTGVAMSLLTSIDSKTAKSNWQKLLLIT